MSRLLEALNSGRVLLMDGAMLTELFEAGLGMEEPGALWNLSRPERVRVVHQGYVAAGAQVLLTNTFQANPIELGRNGCEDDLLDIISAGVRLARSVAGPDRFVLADIGPILFGPGEPEFADRADLARVAEAFSGPDGSWSQIDGILIETCSTPRALEAVEFLHHRIVGADGPPLFLSLSYLHGPDGQLQSFSGHTPETFARHAERHGVAALGVNCGRDIDMADTAAVIRRYRHATDLPLFARPNAGTPREENGRWIYPRSAAMMADGLQAVLEAGAAMVGGCCGTTPEYVEAFRRCVGEPAA